MAWEQVHPRSGGRGGHDLPAEPYARIGNGQISINNAYLERLGLRPGGSVEVYVDRAARRIGLKPAPDGSIGTAILRKQSRANVSVLSSTRTLTAAGLHRYVALACPIRREGDLAVIDIGPRGEDDGGR